MPHLYIITGSNGAGKSTIGPDYLPTNITANNIIFNGDLLFTIKRKELFPKVTKSAKYANKEALAYVVALFENLVSEALDSIRDFAYEGHFTNDETWEIPRRFKDVGYTVHLIFLGLQDPDASESRVAERVLEGGHYVDRETIEENFYGNLKKLNEHHHLIDELIIIDTTDIEHKILYKTHNHVTEFCVPNEELPDWFKDSLPSLL